MLLGTLSLPAVACSPWENYGFNVLLRMSLSSGDRTRTAETVFHAGYYYNAIRFDEIREYSRRIWGDAIAVPVASGAVLFGLLLPPEAMRGFYANGIENILGQHLPPGLGGPVYPYLERLEGRFELQREDWPAVAYFRDQMRPETFEILDPLNLPGQFGAGAHIQSVTVEVTGRPVTEQIAEYLPWLEAVKKGRYGKLDRPRAGRFPPAASRTTYRSFELRGEEM